MTIERTLDEIIIRIPSSVNVDEIQQLIDYLTYKQVLSKSEASQKEVDSVVAKVKKGRWAERRNMFIK